MAGLLFVVMVVSGMLALGGYINRRSPPSRDELARGGLLWQTYLAVKVRKPALVLFLISGGVLSVVALTRG